MGPNSVCQVASYSPDLLDHDARRGVSPPGRIRLAVLGVRRLPSTGTKSGGIHPASRPNLTLSVGLQAWADPSPTGRIRPAVPAVGADLSFSRQFHTANRNPTCTLRGSRGTTGCMFGGVASRHECATPPSPS
jgi:hypothetical protein